MTAVHIWASAHPHAQADVENCYRFILNTEVSGGVLCLYRKSYSVQTLVIAHLFTEHFSLGFNIAPEVRGIRTALKNVCAPRACERQRTSQQITESDGFRSVEWGFAIGTWPTGPRAFPRSIFDPFQSPCGRVTDWSCTSQQPPASIIQSMTGSGASP